MREKLVCIALLALASACRSPGNSSAEEQRMAPPSAPVLVNVPRTAPVGQPSPAPEPRTQPIEPSAPLFEGSVYDLTAELIDQNGAKVSLDVFRGHPVLVTLFYASCPNACPLLTSDLKRIDRELPPGVREKLRVLMVSFDAARDTPQELARHAENHRLDLKRWKLASLDDASARELAGVLGIRYRKLDNGEYFHSSAILLLDETGRPKARMEGLGRDPEPILAVLR
jgi:protein SCO1/2